MSRPVIPAKAGIQKIRAGLSESGFAGLADLQDFVSPGLRLSPGIRAAARLPPVIPAKAGIQKGATKPATRNQA